MQQPQETNNESKIILSIHDKNVDYAKIKELALKHSPMVATVPLSAIELGRNKTIKIEGKIIPTTEKAYFSFLKRVLKVNPAFLKRFKSMTDDKTEMSLLQSLKSGMTLRNNELVHVLANPNTKTVTSFTSGKHMYRDNESLLKIFEMTMNRYPKLNVRDCQMDTEGNLHIAARTDNVSANSAAHFKNEQFRGGLTFRNSYDSGSFIGSNAFRMVCTNGMMGFNDLPLFVGPSERELLMFFEKLNKLNSNEWMDLDFYDKIDKAMKLNASIAELKTAKNIILSNSLVTEDTLDSFLPEYRFANKWLIGKKVDVETLRTEQMKNCPTNQNLWDVINRITDFGSHDYGMNAHFDKIQYAAGKMFGKSNFDAENLVVFA